MRTASSNWRARSVAAALFTVALTSATLDLAAIAFLAGLALAIAGRYLIPTWRIRSKTKPEDALILGVLVFIGLSGLLTEAARISLAGRPDFEMWSFVGYPLSFLFDAAGAAA